MKQIFLMIITIIALLAACQPSGGTENEKKNTAALNKSDGATNQALGKRMFILCQACHNLQPGGTKKVGPNLHQVFGKPAASTEGFQYSEALKSSGIVWDEESMRQWIQDPSSYVPGSNMAFVGVHKKEQQDALIAYLKEETK